ncbi:hypothetical protein TPA0907_26460 [Micromonospora humidisoli]|nr:hypothetical protein TPA0907_26460 [Micromonospora sp. AKA109]
MAAGAGPTGAAPASVAVPTPVAASPAATAAATIERTLTSGTSQTLSDLRQYSPTSVKDAALDETDAGGGPPADAYRYGGPVGGGG